MFAQVGCFARGEQGDVCNTRLDCRGELHCYRGRCSLPDLCRATPSCAKRGVCTAWGHECIVADDRDCLYSDLCAERGLCRAVNAACAATADHDCAVSANCRELGACKAEGGQCATGGRAAARCGEACDTFGRCTIGYAGSCTVGSDRDCSAALVCRRDGKCGRSEGLPGVATDVASTDVFCAATQDAGCEASESCKTLGFCKALRGQCVASSDGWCAASAGCRSRAACSLVGDHCEPVGADCRNRLECKDKGQCTGVAGGCKAVSSAECEASRQCRMDGACTARNGVCVTAFDEDCIPTAGCLTAGACSVAQGRCAVLTRSDCEMSVPCRREGRCSPRQGRCVVQSNRDCAGTTVCDEQGRCRAVSAVAERLAHWHAGQLSLPASGLALPEDATGSVCGIRFHSDCRRSRACAVEKRCRAWLGRCLTREDWRRLRLDAQDADFTADPL
ncbi:MAG: hypothetical protein EXR77_09905 [Myxococcales bacterium]|nr:hypothetical protein [Myxococcales bacterium]